MQIQRGFGKRHMRMVLPTATIAATPGASMGNAMRDAIQMPMSQASVKRMRGVATRQLYHHFHHDENARTRGDSEASPASYPLNAEGIPIVPSRYWG